MNKPNTCCSDEKPCPYYCTMHGKHHVVRAMVQYCQELEAATTPDARPKRKRSA